MLRRRGTLRTFVLPAGGVSPDGSPTAGAGQEVSAYAAPEQLSDRVRAELGGQVTGEMLVIDAEPFLALSPPINRLPEGTRLQGGSSLAILSRESDRGQANHFLAVQMGELAS
jgi:hypothetical protein